MNPLITLKDFNKLQKNSYNLLLCTSRREDVKEYIPESLLYYIDADANQFIHRARCLELDEDKSIIVYDLGEFTTACKAYWGFRATGHDDARILVGGLGACENFGLDLASGVPEDISQTDPYLPFNNAAIISFKDFVKKESYYEQVICAEKAEFELLDTRGQIVSEQQLLKALESSNIVFLSNKATIVYGKSATVVGVLLKYLGHRSVSVVLESTEGFVSSKKSHKISVPKVDVFDPGQGPTPRTLPFIDPTKAPKPKHEPVEEQSRSICSCIVF